MREIFNDLGLGLNTKRLINKNGSYNVRRVGQPLSAINLYQYLIKMSWYNFLLLTFGSLFLINCIFAFIYYGIGIDELNGINASSSPITNYLHCLFFSLQTFTTVGYGHISPKGELISLLAAIEAMIGLLIFAVFTGLLYGRFARPSAKILYSDNLLVTPYRNGVSYQFRIVNKRKSIMMDMKASVLVSFSEKGKTRRYLPMELERSSVVLFPLNWTIVHPVTKESPLFGLTVEDLKNLDAEFIITLKGYDDTFSQNVNSVHSYRYDEIVWGAKFDMMYEDSLEGYTLLYMDKINSHHLVNTSVNETGVVIF